MASSREPANPEASLAPASDPWSPARLATLPHVIIVGGGFGGLRAARELSKGPVRITLVDRQNHHLFQPLLYQIAMAGLSPADIAVPIRAIFHNQENVRVWLGEVSEVNLGERSITLRDGQRASYDYLVLAAGARTNYFGHEESWRPHALPLKKIDHAIEIRRRVLLAFEAAEREPDARARQRLLTFVVIGGGPTGVEVAGALAELARRVLAGDFRVARPEHARVIIVEALDRVLPGFAADLAQEAVRELRALGVVVRLSSPVRDIDARGVQVGEENIEAATVLWTAGVRPPEIAEHLGVQLTRAGRVSVAPDCSLPGHPEVFVIGDMAHFAADAEGKPLPGLAPVAMQQGTYVAGAIRSRMRGGAITEPFVYKDRGMMATIGRSRAVLQTERLKLSGFVAWLTWTVIHIWYLIGFRNRVAVMLNWCWNYLTYRQGARLITGGKEPDRLRQLAAPAERRLTNGSGAVRITPAASSARR